MSGRTEFVMEKLKLVQVLSEFVGFPYQVSFYRI
jgi:hypothetical protein